ncbi:hypothetical protein GOQ04_16995 [Emticicia sp. ODNR4P]|nr:hypothetical protein [Emticicia sp. ODNR4P]
MLESNGMAQITINTKTDSEAIWWMELANKLGTEIQVVFGSTVPADGHRTSSASMSGAKRKLETSKLRHPKKC